MKTLRILSILIVAALMFSCERDVKDEVKTGEVSFGISHLDPMSAKDDPIDNFIDDPECPEGDMVPVTAYIIIDGFTEPFTPDVFYLNGELYTQAIRFQVNDEVNGDIYTITEFLLLNAAGHPIMATPKEGSDFEQFLTNPDNALDLDFTVNAFRKTEKKIEVLCYMEHTYTSFGYNWFLIDQIIVREMCFFGDLCHKDPEFFLGTIYDDVFNLEDHNYPFDLPALFEVRVSKGAQTWVYQNFDDNDNFIAPLCVKYPDLLKVKNEIFTFELWVYVPVGDGVQLLLFDTWELQEVDGVLNWSPYLNEFDVVEFVIGNCNYDVSDINVYPPWQNLPVKTNASIDYKNYTIGGYWELVINNVTPAATKYDFPTPGTYLGWCGDPNQVITSTTHDFFVYGSLNDNNWPTGMPVNLADLAAVNWLFNNLHLYFDIDPIQGNFIEPTDLPLNTQESKDLQHAIWLSLGYTQGQFPGPGQGGGTASPKAIGMSVTATQNSDFIPLPGGWAAVLLIKEENGLPKVATNQLIFTMVDP